MSDEVRNGYEQIAIHFTVEGDAPAEVLREIVEQSRARSAVFDALSTGCPSRWTSPSDANATAGRRSGTGGRVCPRRLAFG